MKLWNVVKKRMMASPDQTLADDSSEMSYRDAVAFACRFARQIENQACCAIYCQSEKMAALAILSCLAAGVTALPLSKRYGEIHGRKILDHVHPTAILTDQNGRLQVFPLSDSDYVRPAVHPAFILCTSGTTGAPKGVMLSDENILTNLKDIASYFRITCTDAILIARPLHHGAVLTGEFLISLMCGVRIYFYSDAFNPQAIWDLMERNRITVFGATPTWLILMSRFRPSGMTQAPSTLCVSGECMDQNTAQIIRSAFPNARIYHVYGLSEASPRVCYLPPECFDRCGDCVGLPLPSVRIKRIKKDGTVANRTEEGVLWVKGKNTMIGYYKDPDLTKKTIRDGWLCTHDLAVLNPEGFLKIKGREDDLIIRSGMNIYPQEIEAALRSDVRVKEALAYGYSSPYGQQIGLKISGDFNSLAEIWEMVRRLLPSFQVPSLIERVDELPKSESGKTLRGKTV